MGVGSLNVRVFWPSTHASIPAGWSRDGNFDEKFLQGDDADYAGPADSGGSHLHTADEHTHIGNPHTHSFLAALMTPSNVTVKNDAAGRRYVADASPPLGQHSHLSATSSAATITYQNETVTINTTDAQPPYMKLIVIKPDLVTKDVPDDAVCFTDETVLPTGFAKYAAIDDSFIRAPSDGADADLAGFGAATHTHTSPAHDHDDDSHPHIAAVCGFSDPAFTISTTPQDQICLPTQHHKVTLDSTTLNDVTTTVLTVNAASSEPAYIKLLGIQNTSGAATTPIGIIVAFVGDADDIPSNWQLCDGTGDTIDCTDKQIKSTGTDLDIGDTGGSNTHTHTTASHNHTHFATHIHTATQVMYLTKEYESASPLRPTPTIGWHSHVWTVGSGLGTMQAETATIQSADGRSAYRTVVWIKKLIERPGPKALLGTTF